MALSMIYFAVIEKNMAEILQSGYPAADTNPIVTLPFERFEDAASLDICNRLARYDSSTPEAEHLRPRQVSSVEAFCQNSLAMLTGNAPMERMSVIHPTGSGKTVLATEIMRIISGGSNGHNAVMLVPSLQILGQVVGNEDDLGDVRLRIPEATVGQYTGEIKTFGNRITVMNYHMLRTAIKTGYWKKLNPKLVIADEIHHIIDGAWADDLEEATQDILTVGLSATPAYDEDRDARDLFPVVLDHMTMKEGIESGILSDLVGHTYRGESRISLSHSGNEFTDEDAFRALANSKDNYLGAAICASEIAKGKRGIISCVPGRDRLHAKVMAKILSQTMVDTPEGRRPINAAYMDSEMDPEEREDILRLYHKPEAEIEVIAFVGLLLEGWNSPLTDFGVWLRPTPSKVLAEQRIGRLLRRRDGKIATLHEVLYAIEGRAPQVTHLDVLEDPNPGKRYAVKGPNRGPRNRSSAIRGVGIDISEITLDEDVSKEVASQHLEVSQNTSVLSSQETVPYDWPTLHTLAVKFGLDHQTIKEFLGASDVETFQEKTGNQTRTFYSPVSYAALAQREGIVTERPEHSMTASELIDYCRHSVISRVVQVKDLEKYLEERGFSTIKCLDGQNVISVYPEGAHESLDDVPGEDAPMGRRKKRYRFERFEPNAEMATRWLGNILINPNEAPTQSRKRQVLLGQNCLLRALDEAHSLTISDIKKLEADIKKSGAKPSEQMENVMKAKKIDFTQLLIAATRAKETSMNLST
jgi:superfamily II DNA or RNA helicase